MNVNFATDCIYLQLRMCGLRRCGPVFVLTGYVSANGHKTRHQSEGIVPRGDGCLDVKEIKSSARRRRGFRIQGILDFSHSLAFFQSCLKYLQIMKLEFLRYLHSTQIIF